MKNKMLVLDIDGTLLNSNHEISPATRDAIIDLEQKGVYIVLASGRPSSGMKMHLQTLGLDTKPHYYIAYNGGQILETMTDNILFSDSLSPNDIARFYDLAETFDGSLITYDKKGLVVSNTNDAVGLEARLNNIPIEVQNKETLLQIETPKMIIANTDEKTLETLHAAQEAYSEMYKLSISLPMFLEITSKTVDKALTLSRLCEQLNISLSEVVACGDGGNDKSMIIAAGTGVAMGNAGQSLKDVADYVTKANDEDGLIDVINKFF